MKIKGIIWFDDIIEKLIRKHNVQQNEVREVLSNKPYFRFVENGHRPNENVYASMGQSNTNAKSFVTLYKISPNPSLSKRGINNPPLKKGDGGGFCNFIYCVCINSGRYLIVFFVYKTNKHALILSV